MGTYTTINPPKLWRKVALICGVLFVVGVFIYGLLSLAGVILHATGALP